MVGSTAEVDVVTMDARLPAKSAELANIFPYIVERDSANAPLEDGN